MSAAIYFHVKMSQLVAAYF